MTKQLNCVFKTIQYFSYKCVLNIKLGNHKIAGDKAIDRIIKF